MCYCWWKLRQCRWPAISKCFLQVPWLSFVWEYLQKFQARQRAAGGDAWLALVFALIFAALFVRTPIGHDIKVGSNIAPQLQTFLRDHPDRFHRPITMTDAGPLLWNMRPNFRVSIDDRGDFYGDETVFSFIDLYACAPGWQKKVEKGNYDSAILDLHIQLDQFLPTMPGWKEVYRDDHAQVFWKDPN